jgi:hypothetical protein
MAPAARSAAAWCQKGVERVVFMVECVVWFFVVLFFRV